MGTEFDILCKARVDEEHGILHGWTIVSKVEGQPYVDHHGDWIPDDAMYTAGLKFALEHRKMKLQHGAHGDGKIRGDVPFIMPLDDTTKAAYQLDGPYTGLAVGLKPYDKSVIADYKSGKYTGLSIGGKRILDEVVDRETGKQLGEIDVSRMRETVMVKFRIGAAVYNDRAAMEQAAVSVAKALESEYDAALDAIAKAAGLVRNKLRRIMRKFEIHEISPVDLAAQEPATIALAKGRAIVSLSEKVAFAPEVAQGGGVPGPTSAPTVKSNQPEPTMDPKDKQIADLTAANEALKAKMAEDAKATAAFKAEADAQKAKLDALSKRFDAVLKLSTVDDVSHVAWLHSDAERDAFLGKGREGRDELIKAATIYKSVATGKIYRAGQDDVADMAKQYDAMAKKLADREASEGDATLAKAAGDLLGKAPNKDVHVVILKAVRGIADEKDRAIAEKWLGVVGKAYGTILKAVGAPGGAADLGAGTGGDPQAQIMALTKAKMEANKGLDEATAYSQVLDEHPELYEAASASN